MMATEDMDTLWEKASLLVSVVPVLWAKEEPVLLEPEELESESELELELELATEMPVTVVTAPSVPVEVLTTVDEEWPEELLEVLRLESMVVAFEPLMLSYEPVLSVQLYELAGL